MFRRSDVNSRVPLFREAQACIDIVRQQGGLEGLPENILTYLDGMRPVGLNDEGALVLPRFYNPEAGPPVLMRKPGENPTDLSLKGTPTDARLAESLFAKAGKKVHVPKQLLNRSVSSLIGDASVILTHLNTIEESGKTTLHIPRFMQVKAGRNPAKMGVTICHELDHWDFFMNDATGMGQMTPPLTSHLNAIAEKRAYTISYRIESRLGYHASAGEIENIINNLPEDACLDDDNTATKYIRASGLGDAIPASLAVLATTRLFGRPDVAITDKEVAAYEELGIFPLNTPRNIPTQVQ